MRAGCGTGGGGRGVPGAVYDVVDGVVVDGGAALHHVIFGDGDILITVFHAYLVPGVQGDVVDAAIVVVGPVCDGLGLARGGVVVGVVGFVDDLVVVGDGGDLAVVAHDAVVAACDGRGAGINIVLVLKIEVRGWGWNKLLISRITNALITK